MRKLFTAALILLAAFTVSMAQDSTSSENRDELAKLARAPLQTDGIGRAVVFISDENGNPVKKAYVTLESNWGSDNFCESFGPANQEGAIALLPIHMGRLKLIVKAKGYATTRLEVAANSLSQPVRVTLAPKK